MHLVPRKPLVIASTILLLCCLPGCTTTRLTEPDQTATEQLLLSIAVDHAVEQLNPEIPPGTKIFVDAQYFDTGDAKGFAKYAIASIRDRLLHQGARLVDDRKDAAQVVELRTGGISIDHRDVLLGLPPIPVPIPLSGTIVTPKIALFENDKRTGIAKIALTVYDRNGALTAATGATYGQSKQLHWVALLLISGNKSDLLPKPPKH